MAGFQRKKAGSPPRLWLFTDARVDDAALLRGVARLPRGAGVVFRHYHLGHDARRALFRAVRAVARRRGIVVLLAGSWRMACRWGADGWHGPGRGAAHLWHSMAVHNAREIARAKAAGADLIFLSPVFATRSHPGGRTLGVMRFAYLVRTTNIAVMALGGMNARKIKRLQRAGACGWGAIDALSDV